MKPFKKTLEKLSVTTGTFGIYIKDLVTDEVLVNINSNEVFPSASVAKVFIAGYINALLNAGTITLKDKLKHYPEDTLQGSGVLKYMDPGREYSVLELLKLMLIESDNTASKMLINHVGVDELNKYIQSYKYLIKSSLKSERSKFVGWGITTPLECAQFLSDLLQNESVVKTIMCDKDASAGIGYHLLKEPAVTHIRIYSKTGTLHPNVKNTVAIIESTTSGQRFLISYFSKDLLNVESSVKIITDISKELSLFFAK